MAWEMKGGGQVVFLLKPLLKWFILPGFAEGDFLFFGLTKRAFWGICFIFSRLSKQILVYESDISS